MSSVKALDWWNEHRNSPGMDRESRTCLLEQLEAWLAEYRRIADGMGEQLPVWTAAFGDEAKAVEKAIQEIKACNAPPSSPQTSSAPATTEPTWKSSSGPASTSTAESRARSSTSSWPPTPRASSSTSTSRTPTPSSGSPHRGGLRVCETALPTRIQRVLKSYYGEDMSLSELAELGEQELLRLPRIGPGGVRRIEACLKEHGRVLATRPSPVTYQSLHDGLSDMIEGGRLTEEMIPDDYRWLVATLEALACHST